MRHINRTFTGTETQAREELARLNAEVQRGALDASERMTFGELLDRWLEHVENRGRALRTVTEYRAKINHRIRPTLGSVRLDRLTAAKLDRQYSTWLADGLSPSTVHHLHRIIRASLNQACRWQLIQTNPALHADPPQVHQPEMHVPDPAQLIALISAAESVDGMLATAIALAALTGARRGELVALKWSDVDLSVGTVRIARSLTVVGGVIHTGPTKTHAVRPVALGAVGIEVLRRRHDAQMALAARTSVPLDTDPYILCDDTNTATGSEHLNPNILTQRFIRLCRTLGVHFRFHDLRHFAATQLIGAGVDVATVAARLGHADPSLTLRVYTHALPERDEHAANVLGALLPPALTPNVDADT